MSELATKFEADPNIPRKDLQKMIEKVVKCKRDAELASSYNVFVYSSTCFLIRLVAIDYRNGLVAWANARQQWESEMEVACDEYQKLEEDRLALLKNRLIRFNELQVESMVHLTGETLDRILVSLQEVDVGRDIANFIQENGTGKDRPPLVYFVDYFTGERLLIRADAAATPVEPGTDSAPLSADGLMDSAHSATLVDDNAVPLSDTTSDFHTPAILRSKTKLNRSGSLHSKKAEAAGGQSTEKKHSIFSFSSIFRRKSMASSTPRTTLAEPAVPVVTEEMPPEIYTGGSEDLAASSVPVSEAIPPVRPQSVIVDGGKPPSPALVAPPPPPLKTKALGGNSAAASPRDDRPTLPVLRAVDISSPTHSQSKDWSYV